MKIKIKNVVTFGHSAFQNYLTNLSDLVELWGEIIYSFSIYAKYVHTFLIYIYIHTFPMYIYIHFLYVYILDGLFPGLFDSLFLGKYIYMYREIFQLLV